VIRTIILDLARSLDLALRHAHHQATDLELQATHNVAIARALRLDLGARVIRLDFDRAMARLREYENNVDELVKAVDSVEGT
jgi:hypothetical protein